MPETRLILALTAVFNVTLMLAPDVFPARSRPMAVIVLTPGNRGTPSARNEQLETTASIGRMVTIPLTSIVTFTCSPLTVPTTMSLIIPVSVIGEDVTTSPSEGESMVTVGGVVSRVTAMLAVAAPPDVFLATAVIVLFPSLSRDLRPERSSAQGCRNSINLYCFGVVKCAGDRNGA